MVAEALPLLRIDIACVAMHQWFCKGFIPRHSIYFRRIFFVPQAAFSDTPQLATSTEHKNLHDRVPARRGKASDCFTRTIAINGPRQPEYHTVEGSHKNPRYQLCLDRRSSRPRAIVPSKGGASERQFWTSKLPALKSSLRRRTKLYMAVNMGCRKNIQGDHKYTSQDKSPSLIVLMDF